MSEARIERQFNKITKGFNGEVLSAACGVCIDSYRRAELGYSPRPEEPIGGENNGKDIRELSRIIESWTFGPLSLLGMGIRKKINYIENIARIGRKAV